MDEKISCSYPSCTVADTGHCFLNHDPISDCPNQCKIMKEKEKGHKSKFNKSSFPFWSGNYLQPSDIEQVSKSSSPDIIGILGTAKAGKTSYLGMLYTLFLNGRFLKDFHFAGSLTLTEWEKQSFALRFHQGDVLFPEATPSNPDFYSIYHLILKNNQNFNKDILFADASGEVFSQWAINKNDDIANSARWIHLNANSFILFVDCQALIDTKAEAKEKVIDIALQLKQDLNKRPVAIVWSKADKIGNVKPQIKTSLSDELIKIFDDQCKEFEVSNYSFEDPDLKCHENNLAVFEWLLNNLQKPSEIILSMEKNITSNDLFLNYR